MPTGRETIQNRRLSGEEARQLILADFEALLAADGLLTGYVAYGRIGWEIELKLHLENALAPESVSSITSRPLGKNTIEAAPQMAAIAPAPLPDPAPDAAITSAQLRRDVTSPNAERLRTGLPVTLDVKQQDGTVSQQHVTYPPEPDAPSASTATVTDTTEVTRAAWAKRIEAAREAKARAAAEQAKQDAARAAGGSGE